MFIPTCPAITLSNNLKSLFLTEGRRYSYWTRTLLFPLLALGPPTAVAMTTHSLEFLVGITGSYAGAGIQYVVSRVGGFLDALGWICCSISLQA